ncbi:glucose 1-dehydrogenase [Aestuariimicrobium sp. T2.26MG-19.2B]|uniref:glucose 1-dehydrogenase n=1 Tax=Aestuariimicrobium sp. T2.26MG-19.2B TaxID=3040679 RepID=UPI002477AAD2|nr:glucose 1-dehydrogenase [Aestuariimicrobium sp. T2.26MG-19.2B]CAI9409105.1 Glucose 1-dehydrogenase [Aestuariimicrobium sp. T2.26MG-19.2B]
MAARLVPNVYPSLAGRTVVVTGGNTGIGAAICRAAGGQGCNVVIDFVGDDSPNARVIADVEKAGGRAIAVRADVTRVDDLQRLVDAAVDQFGRLDVWVNNAGVETRSSLLEATEAHYDLELGVNLKGAFFGAQVAAKRFIKQRSRGVIVNVSSVHEDWPMPGNAIYCCSKGGMRMLARNGAVELAGHGIRMVNVAPGAVRTPMNAATLDEPKLAEALEEAIPLGRVSSPDEIASVVLFAASDGASYLTAETITVDGGVSHESPGL